MEVDPPKGVGGGQGGCAGTGGRRDWPERGRSGAGVLHRNREPEPGREVRAETGRSQDHPRVFFRCGCTQCPWAPCCLSSTRAPFFCFRFPLPTPWIAAASSPLAKPGSSCPAGSRPQAAVGAMASRCRCHGNDLDRPPAALMMNRVDHPEGTDFPKHWRPIERVENPDASGFSRPHDRAGRRPRGWRS